MGLGGRSSFSFFCERWAHRCQRNAFRIEMTPTKRCTCSALCEAASRLPVADKALHKGRGPLRLCRLPNHFEPTVDGSRWKGFNQDLTALFACILLSWSASLPLYLRTFARTLLCTLRFLRSCSHTWRFTRCDSLQTGVDARGRARVVAHVVNSF